MFTLPIDKFLAILGIVSNLFLLYVSLFPIIFNGANANIIGEKCYDDLGCFSNGPPFFDIHDRPVSLLPEDDIPTKFLLYKSPDTRTYTYIEPNMDSLLNSSFDPSLETKVIIHGFNAKFNAMDYLFKLKDELLSYDDYNLVFVNWTKSNNAPNYPQAVANARVVGAQLARLLQFLHDNGPILLEDVHVIGHSLGGHIAGWAGERLENLGRISGLDPAGPYFQNAIDLVRLDITDALFVDVMHTNGGTNLVNGLGLLQPIGHVDFYPNGGSMQPGCESNFREDSFEGIADTATDVVASFLPNLLSPNSCSHRRTVDLYSVTVRNETQSFQGLACDSWEKYQKGECNIRYRQYRTRLSLTMGFHATQNENITKSSKFYLETAATPPFVLKK